MDKVLVLGAKDCRLESCQGHLHDAVMHRARDGKRGGIRFEAPLQHRAHGVVVSRPLRMRKALGSSPSVSILASVVAEGNPAHDALRSRPCVGRSQANFALAPWPSG